MRRLDSYTPMLVLVLAVGSGCGSGGIDTPDESSTSAADSETGEVCELQPNEVSEQTAIISIRNDRAAPIYVTPYSSFFCNYGQVEIDVGGAPALWDHASTYSYDCSTSLCGYGCSDGGAKGLIINPGATAQIEWGGAVWTTVPLSDACRAEQDCVNDLGPTCNVRELVEGEYLVRVNLTETCPVENECLACTDGVCEVFFYEPSLAEVSESIEVAGVFPDGVDVVVD